MRVSDEWIDNILMECGGFGRYQVMLLTILFFYGKLSVTWSMMVMTIAGAVPDWWCVDNETNTDIRNQSDLFMKCYLDNETHCNNFSFDGSMRTVVSEWNLVCDEAWTSSTITTIQMAGYLISALISGHFSDLFGRKPTLFISIVSLTVLNFVAYFSVSWKMFATVRFLLGFACASYLVVYFTLLIEFMPARQRPIINALPSWTIWAAALGGVAWLIPDWANLHITTAAVTFPLLFTWRIVPESFRWLLSKNRTVEAEAVLINMAKINKQPLPDTSQMKSLQDSKDKTQRYSVRDIFRGKKLAKSTVLFSLMWMSSGYTYYAISFGVQQLSGSIYLNMFLLSIVELPANAFTYYLLNKFGRKWICVLFYTISCVASFGVAISQVIDIDQVMKGRLINGFALAATIGNSAGWCSVDLLTIETYPTVVRNIGYGFQSTAARVGAMIAPQIVYLSSIVPGLMYFICGGLMILSTICALFLEETRDKPLSNTFDKVIIGGQETKEM